MIHKNKKYVARQFKKDAHDRQRRKCTPCAAKANEGACQFVLVLIESRIKKLVLNMHILFL